MKLTKYINFNIKLNIMTKLNFIIWLILFVFVEIHSAISVESINELKSINKTDSLKTYLINEDIQVVGNLDKCEKHKDNLNNIDNYLATSKNISLVKRGGYFNEIFIRGNSSDRLNITIDGMHIFGACTDKMDPATSYIEPDNLQSINVSCHESESAVSQTGGSVDFRTKQLNYNQDFKYSLSTYISDNSNNFTNRLVLNYSKENIAFGFNAVVKRAGNYSDGNNNIIENSSYNKENYKFDFRYQLNQDLNISTYAIYDNSFDIGFPALIMDTRSAKSFISSIDLSANNNFIIPNLKLKIYYNQINHIMDDYDRRIEEIKNREIMPNMYMPMVSFTKTMGVLISEILTSNNEGNKDGQSMHKFTLDFFRSLQDAKMDMVPLDNARIMRLKNIAGSEINNLSLKYSWLTSYDNSIMNISFGSTFLNANLNKNSESNAFMAFINQEKYSSNYLLFNSMINYDYNVGDYSTIQNYISFSERSPNVLELYSYYVYNPMDNSINFGNPNLNKESVIKLESSYNLKDNDNLFGKINYSISAYYNYFLNYILPYTQINVDKENEITNQNFITPTNINNAQILGANLHIELDINDFISDNLSISYTLGRLSSIGDNMPFIIPFVIKNTTSLNFEDVNMSLVTTFNSSQLNISQVFNREDITKSFIVFDFFVSANIYQNLILKFNTFNMFNQFYITHNSINNLPSMGRELSVELQWKVQ